MTADRGTGPAITRRPRGAGLLRLYPGIWRRRYEAEVLATLEQLDLGSRGWLDLIRGAFDARLHTPSRAPAAAALVAGGLWAFAGAGVLAQPAPPDWPGYLLESLPIAIVAIAAGGLATIGCWARRSDSAGRAGTLAITLAIVGDAAWIAALAAAWFGLGYGSAIAVAQGLGAVGALLVGLLLLRSNDAGLGAILVLASALMMFAWPAAWLGFGLAWTLVGALLFARAEPDGLPPTQLA
jgi:hypothetical protein